MSVRSVIVCTLLIAGCGGGDGGHSIDASKFSRACAADTDCVAVYQGTLGCCGGDCPNTAIAASSYDAYEAALQMAIPRCNPAPPCAAPVGVCGDRSALCVGGTCTYAVNSSGALSSSGSPPGAGS
jgi:hypothetical protein